MDIQNSLGVQELDVWMCFLSVCDVLRVWSVTELMMLLMKQTVRRELINREVYPRSRMSLC